MPQTTEHSEASTRWPGGGGHTASFGTDLISETRLQAALTAGRIAAWYSDLRTRERWWSPEMLSIHGLSSSEEAPSDYLSVVHPDDRERVQEVFKQSVATGAHELQYRVVWPDGSVHWLEGIGQSTRDDAGLPLAIRGTCTLIDARRREDADLRFLAQASAELARGTDYEETLRRLAAMAVPHFADWCAVDMLDDTGELRRLAVAHVDPEKVALAQELHRRYPPLRDATLGTWNVIRTGAPEMLAEITDELLERSARDAQHLEIARSLGLRSYMGIPIAGPDRVLGVITFVSSDSRRVYGQRDLDLATDLVSRASVAIQNATLFRALNRSQVRQAFLLSLTDALRGNGTTNEILRRVCAMLGRHFGVNRVGYGQVDEIVDNIAYDVCWNDGTVPPLLGEYPASAFGQPVIDRLRAGQTIAIPNVREHPLTSDEGTVRTSHEVDTRAILVVPLSRAGKLRTIVYLNQRLARTWTGEEIALMEEVAERTRELIERGHTEDALRASEARWRGLFERMAEGFFVAEAVRDGTGRMVDFRFLQVNPAFEKLTGVPVDSAIGRKVTEIIPGFQREIIDAYAGVVDTGTSVEFEVNVPALQDRWYEARAQWIAPQQFSVLFLEVTDRKTAQLEQARLAQRYRTLFESIDEGFCILDVLFDAEDRACDYRFVEVNPAFERHAGVRNAVGRTIRELVPEIDSAYIETYGRVAKTGEPVRFESRAEALQRWFDAFAFRVGEPELRRIALLFTDITERKRTQLALIERESELHEAQRLAGIGSWYWHIEEDRLEVSPELLRMFGLEPGSEFPSFARQKGTIYSVPEWDRLNEAVQAAIATAMPYSLDVRACRAGRPIWVTAQGTAVRDDAGRVVGLRGTLQDITARKETEELLREADVRKDQFLATLAHELRNPLAPLRNGLAILSRSGVEHASAVRSRELMERQLAHLVRLVDDLLDVSRVSQGKVTMKKAVTSLQAVVDLALETSRPLIDAGGHKLTVTLPPTPILMDVDATRMAQVLSNLLNNAAKYTPPGGRIALVAETQEPGQVRVEVRDNGIGIPQDMLERVFDLFTQVGGAQDRAQGGLGIGLSLARRLVELHAGSIRAESAGANHGSSFILELPVVAPGPQAAPGSAGEGHLARKGQTSRRVLVVDDNKDAAETLGMLLEMEGHKVRLAHSGSQAIELATRHRPEVIFLDIGLPDMEGYDVAATLRADPDMKPVVLVALTGWGAERDQARSRAAGIHLHLTKPVTPDDIWAALARAGN